MAFKKKENIQQIPFEVPSFMLIQHALEKGLQNRGIEKCP